MSYQTDCNGCGLSVHDLPDEAGDAELLLEVMFDRDDAGDLYCHGCAQSWGVWL